jgi:hypothetical protein
MMVYNLGGGSVKDVGHVLEGYGGSPCPAGRATPADGSDCAFIVAGGDGSGREDV